MSILYFIPAQWLPLIESGFYALIFPGFVTILLLAFFIIWFERKAAARVQMRYGPLWVSRKTGGLIQLLADMIRFSFQEFIVPEGVDFLPFIFIPGFLLAFAVLPTIFIPIGPDYAKIFPSSYTLLLASAFTLVIPIYLIVVGWAADNKFSFIGALREGYLLISYEVPYLLVIASAFLLYRTLDLVKIVNIQAASVPGIILNPVAAIVYLLVVIRSTGRVPYDIVEADSELIFGPYTEYSSLMFGFVMGVPYIELYGYSLLFATLFLGGWIPLTGVGFLGGLIIPGIITFVKAVLVMCLLVFLRAVYPRYKLDKAIKTGWTWVLYLAFVSLIISAFASYLI